MNNQISKPAREKKSTISLILGIISGGLFVIGIGFMSLRFVGVIPITEFHSRTLAIILLSVSPLIALIGLIFGITSLKSQKEKFAIIGIGLCGIVLIWTLWLLGELFVVGAGF